MLQFLGQNLQEQNIKLCFHTSFCTPEEEIKKLKDAAAQALPLKFIKGNGDYLGVYIIQEIRQSSEQTSPQGDLILARLELVLVEFTGKIPENSETEKGFKKKA